VRELQPRDGQGSPAAVAVVTGASGWLGQNLVRALAAQPHRERIRCLVRQRDEGALLEVIDPRIEAVAGDVRDPVTIDTLFDGIGRASVFHTAAVIHPERSTREFFDVNVGGTQLMLDRARRVGVARFVHVSSNAPFGANASVGERFDETSSFNPYLGYGKSKLRPR
jgi:nucleoside-diphosphate-sugar epimerase